MTMLYTPRLEIAKEYEDGIYVEDVFEDWDAYSTEEEARSHVPEILEDIRNERYWHNEDQFFAISIEIDSIENDGYNIVDIIDVYEKVNEGGMQNA